jgi:hypothetical protein
LKTDQNGCQGASLQLQTSRDVFQVSWTYPLSSFICRKRNSPTFYHKINQGKQKRGERVG